MFPRRSYGLEVHTMALIDAPMPNEFISVEMG